MLGRGPGSCEGPRGAAGGGRAVPALIAFSVGAAGPPEAAAALATAEPEALAADSRAEGPRPGLESCVNPSPIWTGWGPCKADRLLSAQLGRGPASWCLPPAAFRTAKDVENFASSASLDLAPHHPRSVSF